MPESHGSRAERLADRLAERLAAHGASTMFGVPGGGPNLELIGAATRHGLRFVLAHGETGAAIMASTHGLLRAEPTPVVVTRGPGAASLTNGLAQATLDRFPLIAVTDAVPATVSHRVAHQRLDQTAMLGPASKVSATVSDHTSDDDFDRLITAALQWPCGGVHLDFDPSAPRSPLPSPPAASLTPMTDGGRDGHRPGSIADALAILSSHTRPLVIVGMEAALLAGAEGHSHAGDRGPASGMGRDLERLGCPVLTTYQAIGVVPTEHETNAGLFTNGALERPVLGAADVIITIGLDLVEPIPEPWSYHAPVIRLSATEQTNDYLPVAVDLVGDVRTSLRALLEGLESTVGPGSRWAWQAGAAERFRTEARARLAEAGHMGEAGSFGPLELVTALSSVVPGSATVTVDAGAHFLAIMPNWPVSRPFGLLISNGLATMGFAVPASIGAALARPNEPVVALTGDGGLSMVLAELETIARHRLPITVVVFNDSRLSLIEIKQGNDHGGPAAVQYRPIDFAAVARAQGLDGHIVTSADELVALVGSGRDRWWQRPRLIDARIDPAAYRPLMLATRG